MILLLVTFACGLLCLLDYIKRQYWKKKGVSEINSSIPFIGHHLSVLTQTNTAIQIYDYGCKKFKNKPYFGLYEFWQPTLVVQDPQVIEQILIKNFSNFLDRPRWIFDKRCILGDSLFTMKGNRWRALRYQMIPWFTTGHLKQLFSNVLHCMTIPTGEVGTRDFLRRIAADTISVFFGSHITDKETLNEMNKRFHDVSFFRFYKLQIIEHFAKITDSLALTLTDKTTDNYFRSIIKCLLSNKNHSLVQRLQKLIDDQLVHLRKKDIYTKSSDDEVYTFEITEDAIIKTAGQFFVAGLDTTSNTMQWLMYDLAMNPKIQTIAREEIRETLKKHGGWSYEAVQDMKYISNCINESMRLHPVIGFLFRTCTNTCTILDGLTIDKGTKIIIPTVSIQRNPDIYPDPESFKPERFNNVEKQTNVVWLAFGEGPRKCAGMRFAQMVMRTYIGRILENHEIVFTNKTKHPVINDTRVFIGRPQNDIFVKLNKVL